MPHTAVKRETRAQHRLDWHKQECRPAPTDCGLHALFLAPTAHLSCCAHGRRPQCLAAKRPTRRWEGLATAAPNQASGTTSSRNHATAQVCAPPRFHPCEEGAAVCNRRRCSCEMASARARVMNTIIGATAPTLHEALRLPGAGAHGCTVQLVPSAWRAGRLCTSEAERMHRCQIHKTRRWCWSAARSCFRCCPRRAVVGSTGEHCGKDPRSVFACFTQAVVTRSRAIPDLNCNALHSVLLTTAGAQPPCSVWMQCQQDPCRTAAHMCARVHASACATPHA